MLRKRGFTTKIAAGSQARTEAVETGYWNIPGHPHCILVDFSAAYKEKDSILEALWENYQVDSLTGGWDNIEPVLFGYTSGKVIRTYCRYLSSELNVIGHWHEWLVGAGMLYLKSTEPSVASVFTTHATILGRSISSFGEDLKENLANIDPVDRASELGVRAKFSLESTVAREADCFTTVSAITAEEAESLFKRAPDKLLPNALGHGDSAEQDSFSRGLLDCPHYTRPEVYQNHSVPAVLLSGNHGEIIISTGVFLENVPNIHPIRPYFCHLKSVICNLI